MEMNHILVVEDDKEIREGVKIYLQSQGYEVFLAADGIEGLEVMEKEDIHLDYRDGILTISGEKNEEKEEKDKDKYLRREFTSYSFHRSFELPEERYDVAKAQAAYKDGILEVTLPKKEQKDKVSRQIEVK
mgnify:CR=1 FL=1